MSYILGTLGDSPITLDGVIVDRICDLLSDFFFLGCVIAILLCILIGISFWGSRH